MFIRNDESDGIKLLAAKIGAPGDLEIVACANVHIRREYSGWPVRTKGCGRQNEKCDCDKQIFHDGSILKLRMNSIGLGTRIPTWRKKDGCIHNDTLALAG
jgi:hypothetical protein